MVAALSAGHPLAASDMVRVADLAREPLIMFSRRLDPEAALELDRLFRQAGAEMNVVHEMDTMLSTLNFVAMGVGCSIVPGFTRRLGLGAVAFRPLQPCSVVKTLAMVTRRGDRGLAARLVDHVSRSYSQDDVTSAG